MKALKARWIKPCKRLTSVDIPAEKIKAVVHDNGAKVVAAANILQEGQAVPKCVAAARSLVEHFKKSELARTKLKDKQKQVGVENMLVQDVCTRWNSTNGMLFRLQEHR